MNSPSRFTYTHPDLRKTLEELRQLEPIFHTPEFGSTIDEFERRMVDDYWEVGASGRLYSRDFVLEMFEHEPPVCASTARWRSTGHALRRLSHDVYLFTYTLAQGRRLTRRSTIWQRAPDGWRLVFHQGTIVTAREDDIAPPSAMKQ